MKILFDFQAFYMQKFGGVSNCFVQLMKRLTENVEYEIAIKESDNGHLRESGILSVSPMSCSIDNFLSEKPFRGKSRLFNVYKRLFPMCTSYGINRQCSINALQRRDFDIFHPTFFDSYFLPYLNGKPFVITVHDMIPELYWANQKQEIQIKNKPMLCEKAAHIIAVSENTKNDLIRMLHVPEEKITVIYHGASTDVNFSNEKPLLDEKYILYVGQRSLYKRFNQMLEAMTAVFNDHPELKLVCTGAPFSKVELKLINHLGLKDRILQLYPTDQELMNLYTYALCFIYPSEYEGFGIPILEAYKAGCPVLLNCKSCFPEIAREAAIYFNLDGDQSDLKDVMEKFLKISEVDKARLIQKQNERLRYFSWKKSAEKLAEVYEMVLGA